MRRPAGDRCNSAGERLLWGWSSGDGDKQSVPGYVYLGGGANRTLCWM